MPMGVELPTVMLAAARIGAVHSVVFGGFSPAALAGRLAIARAAVMVTCDGVGRGGKWIDLKGVADEAVAICATEHGHTVRTQVVVASGRTGGPPVPMTPGRDVWWDDALRGHPDTCEVVWVDAEDPLFCLFTSGSTGAPKGIVHTVGGYMVGSATTFKYSFNYQTGDVFFCTADCGWITGHTYVTYGPLLNRATQVIFEGIPTYPDAGRLWAIVAKYGVTAIYTAPTALRSLKRSGDAFVTAHDRSSLKILGSVGEPINPEAWDWYHTVVGNRRAAVVDSYWQTETGAHVVAPLPVAGLDLKPGAAQLPHLGIVPALLDDGGNVVEGEGSGHLVLAAPWPSALRTLMGDHARMEATYFTRFPGYYMTGDGARRDADGHLWLTGRTDDVLNVSGHLLGTAEVESAIVGVAGIAEAAVVGVPHEVTGQAVYAFVVLMPGVVGSDALRAAIAAGVRSRIGPIARIETMHWVGARGLPKTRSGKILRRLLRKIAGGGGGGGPRRRVHPRRPGGAGRLAGGVRQVKGGHRGAARDRIRRVVVAPAGALWGGFQSGSAMRRMRAGWCGALGAVSLFGCGFRFVSFRDCAARNPFVLLSWTGGVCVFLSRLGTLGCVSR
ncbi:hypothetical protein BU14_0111s0054 [Porphyra umbilicalis]|uniref:acetate--CoA ligase n=1 Tax=Porphyra umbilicalis TaxID=2786 RepID=A0A1X6PCE2_PORUM|nr:hypothetical protein BU14_0111s0054 [Porphyra umbilicalis]|eukprot:OSX78385.1 hypothetical protein BU14_0111s0054 [Porphyra umbilicalis]